ncbi:MAG: type secretion system protein, partial [Verrucomicrobiales bacterium]|nr:type secretion system protein [Verrucomicrobiales bacterium]
ALAEFTPHYRKLKHMKNLKSRKSGFTLVEIMIVVAIIGLLAAIAIPNFVRARTKAQQNACINNLRQIDGAIQQWALENKKGTNAAVTHSDITGFLKTPPTCPAGGTSFAADYTLSTVAATPLCAVVAASHTLP